MDKQNKKSIIKYIIVSILVFVSIFSVLFVIFHNSKKDNNLVVKADSVAVVEDVRNSYSTGKVPLNYSLDAYSDVPIYPLLVSFDLTTLNDFQLLSWNINFDFYQNGSISSIIFPVDLSLNSFNNTEFANLFTKENYLTVYGSNITIYLSVSSQDTFNFVRFGKPYKFHLDTYSVYGALMSSYTISDLNGNVIRLMVPFRKYSNDYDYYGQEYYFETGVNLTENEYYNTGYNDGLAKGYEDGINQSKLGIFANSTSVLNVRSTTSIDGVPTFTKSFENPFVNYYNGLIINPELIAVGSELYNLSNDYIYGISINLNSPFVYNHDNLSFGFINNNVVQYPTTINYFLTDINNNLYDGAYTVTPVYDSENKDNLLTFNVTDNYPVTADGKSIVKIGFSVGGQFLKENGVYVFQNGLEYQNGYNVGYLDATKNIQNEIDDAYNRGQNSGLIIGYNDGYSEGLANASNATFQSMIGAVIDVPINALCNLFNFEILGVNLFGFFTGLFTLLIIITIIRLFIGGK